MSRADEIAVLSKAFLSWDGSAICPHCGTQIETGMEGEAYALPDGGFELICECPNCEQQFRASQEYEQEKPDVSKTSTIEEAVSAFRWWFWR